MRWIRENLQRFNWTDDHYILANAIDRYVAEYRSIGLTVNMILALITR